METFTRKDPFYLNDKLMHFWARFYYTSSSLFCPSFPFHYFYYTVGLSPRHVRILAHGVLFLLSTMQKLCTLEWASFFKLAFHPQWSGIACSMSRVFQSWKRRRSIFLSLHLEFFTTAHLNNGNRNNGTLITTLNVNNIHNHWNDTSREKKYFPCQEYTMLGARNEKNILIICTSKIETRERKVKNRTKLIKPKSTKVGKHPLGYIISKIQLEPQQKRKKPENQIFDTTCYYFEVQKTINAIPCIHLAYHIPLWCNVKKFCQHKNATVLLVRVSTSFHSYSNFYFLDVLFCIV